MADRQKHLGLFTDLYELTMAAAYFENQFTAKASFELFVRSLPPKDFSITQQRQSRGSRDPYRGKTLACMRLI